MNDYLTQTGDHANKVAVWTPWGYQEIQRRDRGRHLRDALRRAEASRSTTHNSEEKRDA
jgi:hypothetical protein